MLNKPDSSHTEILIHWEVYDWIFLLRQFCHKCNDLFDVRLECLYLPHNLKEESCEPCKLPIVSFLFILFSYKLSKHVRIEKDIRNDFVILHWF